MNTLRVGYPTYWGSLVPALQHTAYADVLLANQFEGLVREASGGIVESLLAKSWRVSPDFTKIEFEIDTSKKFSNGEGLTADTVKKAWEYGLKLEPRSANSSLQDVLYVVKGFSEFPRTGNLEGVRVINDHTLIVEFIKPFRTALAEFGTGRMSVFTQDSNGLHGTGPYIIHEKSDQHLVFTQNPFYPKVTMFPSVDVTVVPPIEAEKALQNGTIDVYGFADRAPLSACQTTVACLAGLESGHLILFLNGLHGRIFENAKYRMAVQYLVHKYASSLPLPDNYKNILTVDPQPYLKLQAGRLPDEEANRIIEEGEKYVSELVEASKRRPIYMVSSEINNWMQDFLASKGLQFTKNSGHIDTKTRMKMIYKTSEPDIVLGASSLASGDPDGLFHSVAKDGAIFAPMTFRKSVSDLLEAGRSILEPSRINAHYQRASRAFLQDLPMVHIGFIRDLYAYNPKRVTPSKVIRDREANQFTMFHPNL